jgi:hypothetical protein
MKLSNIFKKDTKTVAKANVEKLEKKQLEKVVGGADLLGGALPGGSVISAAVSSVSNTKGGSAGGASSASYA